jgi:hypothetical protein
MVAFAFTPWLWTGTPIKWNGFLGNWSPWSTAYILGLKEPQSNEMDFLEIDLLGPQPTRLTKSATTCSTIHQKTMWIIIWRQTRWIISCSHNYLMHSKIIIQNHSTLAVLSSQLDVLCANPMKIKIPKRVMPLM